MTNIDRRVKIEQAIPSIPQTEDKEKKNDL
jgi:hypothetical protein